MIFAIIHDFSSSASAVFSPLIDFSINFPNICGKMKYSSIKRMADNENKNSINYHCPGNGFRITGRLTSPFTILAGKYLRNV
jgi:hypothetical protein